MSRIKRRDFVFSVDALGATTSVLGGPSLGQAKTAGGRVVVIGGGGWRCYLCQVSPKIVHRH